MHARSRSIVSVILSCGLALSPLRPVSYAIAQEQADQTIEALGSEFGTGAAGQSDGMASATDDQAVVLGDEPTSVGASQQGEKTEQVESVEIANEGDDGAKGKGADATALKGDADPQDQKKADDKKADENAGGITFVDAEGNENTCAESVNVTAETKTMESSNPYVVGESLTCKERITVKGDVKLLLCNGCELTCQKGIEVAEGGHLHIFGQKTSEDTKAGKLVCETKGSKVAALSVNAGSKLTIESGQVEATCKTNDGAGIGGDRGRNAGEINIKGGVVNAKSKMNGAGIGGGKKGDGGHINITGGNVTAEAGDEDGAGIGGGEEGWGGIIVIKGNGVSVAKTDEKGMPVEYECDTTVTATGAQDAAGIGGGYGHHGGVITIDSALVTAKGKGRGAGIGGGAGVYSGDITIVNGANVKATGGSGAGIGTGAAALMKDNPSRVVGGDITIKDSDVHAVSAMGGAGIGGGIFGHADSITISGGKTFAMGGMNLGPGTISAGFQAAMVFNVISGDWAKNDVCDVSWLCKLTYGAQLAFIGWLIECFSDKPHMIYYTGAGIGGGYHEASGDITITDNASVTATAGMLPPNNVLRKLFKLAGADEYLKFKAPDPDKKSYAIGNGAGYEGEPSIDLYDEAGVQVTMVDLDVAEGHDLKELDGLDLGNFDAVKSVIGSLLDKNMSPNPPRLVRGDKIEEMVAKYNSASVAPVTTVSFDRNANDAWGYVKTQDVLTGMPAPLLPCPFERYGYTFAGWSTSPDGDVVFQEGMPAVFDAPGDVTLYAKWNAVPKTDLASFGYAVKLGGSTTDVLFSLNNLTDDPANYGVRWTVNGIAGGEEYPRSKDRNVFTIEELSGKQLVDEIEVSIVHKTADGQWEQIGSQKISVKDYCDYVICRNGKINDKVSDEQASKLVDLCKATLDYGTYVQLSCGYRTDCLANEHVEKGDWFGVKDVQLPEPSMTKSPEAEAPQGIKYEDIGLNLSTSEHKDAICIGYEPGAALIGYQVSVKDGDGKELDRSRYERCSDGHYFSFEFPEASVKGKGDKIGCPGVPMKDLDRKIVVSLTRNGKTLEVGASPMDFMCSKISQEKIGEKEMNVMRALYSLSQKAKAFTE